jgi:hypothetical protein
MNRPLGLTPLEYLKNFRFNVVEEMATSEEIENVSQQAILTVNDFLDIQQEMIINFKGNY